MDIDREYRKFEIYRKKQQEELSEKIKKAGEENILLFISSSYGVSLESCRIYKKRHNQYPLLYYVGDTEIKIVDELNEIERFLKIKKLRNVQ